MYILLNSGNEVITSLNPFTPNSAIWHSESGTGLKNQNFLKQANLGTFTSSHQALVN
jgi:hypothetical protein